jgi:glycerophosphoryl diester phosphodiesterase
MNSSKFKIIAHRGSSYIAPENTISSARLAMQENADALELDIHLTKDNQIVVIHDSNTKRTSGINKKVKNLKLNELKQLDFGSWKNKKWNGEKIPTLEEIFNIVPKEKSVFVEIKSGYECLFEIRKLIDDGKIDESQMVLMDFNFETVLKAKKMFPNVEVLWLYEFEPLASPKKKRILLDKIIEIAVLNKIDGINIENVKQLDANFIQKAKENGLKCYCWTVDNCKRAKYLMSSGIDGIATNKPGWMKLRLNLNESEIL